MDYKYCIPILYSIVVADSANLLLLRVEFSWLDN